MSGKQIRKEPVCLNCQQEVPNRFCSYCGQENVEPRESFGSLLTHFFNDFTHFDGKFFKTIRVLLFQPGKLTALYISGTRASFLHPIRMYFFISFAFFLIIFLSGSHTETADTSQLPTKDSVISRLNAQIDSVQKNFAVTDTGITGFVAREKILQLEKKKWVLEADSTKLAEIWNTVLEEPLQIQLNDSANNLASPEWYEVQQKRLPPNQRDGKLEHWLKKKIANANGLSQNGNSVVKFFEESIKALLPKMMFVSLPLFAFLLYILYRRKRIWGYTEHAILTLHLFSASFLILLVEFLVTNITNSLRWDRLTSIIGVAFTLCLLIYYYLSLKKFYGQSALKTISKMMLLLIGSLLIFISLFLFAIGFAFIRIH
ncbi:MAG: DUF3667 domain-containing protein [Sediminibacterium sp.]|nr:DUF3667 domain-containing protein [Sediminibacterium sp.]